MKKISVLLIFISSIATGQEISPIVKFLVKRNYTFPDSVAKNKRCLGKWPDTVYYNTVYKAKLLGSATIPISFSSIEFTNNSSSTNTAANSNEPLFGLGLGYTWFLGDFIFNENDKVTVDPTLFFGAVASGEFGSTEGIKQFASFVTGGFIGVGAFTLVGGYDFISHSLALGLGGRIDFFTISQNFLHVFGKVHEVRKHKKIAQPITIQ